MTGVEERIALVEVSGEPLDVAAVHAAAAVDGAGGVCVFVGAVRDHDNGRAVSALGYSAHPSALAQMRRVATEVATRHDALAVAAVHRVGDLVVGDLAVVVAVATAHRDAAFVACRELIDELKATVPIWKHQVFDDGEDEWVGLP